MSGHVTLIAMPDLQWLTSTVVGSEFAAQPEVIGYLPSYPSSSPALLSKCVFFLVPKTQDVLQITTSTEGHHLLWPLNTVSCKYSILRCFLLDIHHLTFCPTLCFQVLGSTAPSLASSSTLSSSSRQYTRQRITRVNLRDLIFYMEQERETAHSLLLYRALLK